MSLLNRWHSWLGMQKHDQAWHERDVADELAELREAKGVVAIWSELSDIVYTVTRARWSGHNLAFPLSKTEFFIGTCYMLPKYTLRWLFFRKLGKSFGKDFHMVRNPSKPAKLRALAEMEGIDPTAFESRAKRLLRFWPLLP